MLRGLGTEGYGAYALAWVLLGYFTLFDLGLGRATTRFVADQVERGSAGALRAVVRTALVLQLTLGALGGLLLALGGGWLVSRLTAVPEALRPELGASVTLLAVALPFVLVTASFAGVLEGLRRFTVLNAVRIPSSLAVLLLPAGAVLAGGGLRAAVLALAAARIAGAIAHGLVVLRALPATDATARPDGLAGALLRYGGWITVSSVVSPLMVYADRFLLGALAGLGAVSHYSAPYDVITRLWLVPSSLASVLFPEFTALGAGRDRAAAARLALRATRALLLVMGLIVIPALALAHPALTLWLGADFAARAARPAQLLLLGMLVNALAWVPMAWLQAVGRPDLPARSHLLQLPFYAALLWWSIATLGATGAAVAWLARVSVDALVLFALAARHGAASLGALRRGAAPVAGAMLPGLVLPWLAPATLRQPLASVLVAGTGLSLALLLGWRALWPEERALLQRLRGSAA